MEKVMILTISATISEKDLRNLQMELYMAQHRGVLAMINQELLSKLIDSAKKEILGKE